MKRNDVSFRSNAKLARQLWGEPSRLELQSLRELTSKYSLSIAAGDLQLLEGRWYVTHSGLLHLASRRGCRGINTTLQDKVSDFASGRWVFKAIVYKSGRSKGFVGYGDADPSNVSAMVQGAELRIAETRAVNRALRKAYGIGLCSVEELGALPTTRPLSTGSLPTNGSHFSNGNGQPRLRDQLCLLIRQYNLDATDFCGTETLRGASRELVESFIAHLSHAAKENRDVLVYKLNSYSRQAEVQS